MSFTQEQIDKVWNKASKVDGVDSNKYRVDPCGAWIMKAKYGKETPLGWEIDHVFPQSKAKARGYTQSEIDHIDNLRATQWENNRSKGDDYPDYNRAITRNGDKNVRNNNGKTVHEATVKKLNSRFKIKRR